MTQWLEILYFVTRRGLRGGGGGSAAGDTALLMRRPESLSQTKMDSLGGWTTECVDFTPPPLEIIREREGATAASAAVPSSHIHSKLRKDMRKERNPSSAFGKTTDSRSPAAAVRKIYNRVGLTHIAASILIITIPTTRRFYLEAPV